MRVLAAELRGDPGSEAVVSRLQHISPGALDIGDKRTVLMGTALRGWRSLPGTWTTPPQADSCAAHPEPLEPAGALQLDLQRDRDVASAVACPSVPKFSGLLEGRLLTSSAHSLLHQVGMGGTTEKRRRPVGRQTLNKQSRERRAVFCLVPSWCHPDSSPLPIYR